MNQLPVPPVNTQKLSMRWDKADKLKYYYNTSSYLQSITPPSDVMNCSNCSHPDHCRLIDNYHDSTVKALKLSDSDSVPRIKPNLLKTFWTDELDHLKQISISTHKKWREMSSPGGSNPLNLERLRIKLSYKNAIHNAKKMFDRHNSGTLNASLVHNNPSSF